MSIDMTVLANDGMHPDGVRLLKEAGFRVDTEKKDPEQLLKVIGKYAALTVRSQTEVPEPLIEAGVENDGKLKVIARQGIGVDKIDVKAAYKYGVAVQISPSGNTIAAAELTIGLMIAVGRGIFPAYEAILRGEFLGENGLQLQGTTLGLFGCGRIGTEVARRAHAFNMNVIGCDPKPVMPPEITSVSLEYLLKTSNFISIHVSGNPLILGEEQFKLMEQKPYIFNVARGGCIDEQALYTACITGKIAGAALDVHANEPKRGGQFKSILTPLPNVLLTPHIGASTEQAQRETSMETARGIIDYLVHGNFTNMIMVGDAIKPEETEFDNLFITNSDVPGAFWRIDEVLSQHGINIRDIKSNSIEGTPYVLTVYRVHPKPPIKVLRELRALDVVEYARL